MRGSPLVYQLEDPGEFSLNPLTDSARPGVQTALVSPPPPEPGEPRQPTLGEWLSQNALGVVFVAVMSLSCAVRWL